MKYSVYNKLGEKVKEVELNPAVFEVPVKEELVHQVLVAQEANARKPLAHTKQRGEVRGGGRKPHRQKGTGRARAGSNRSPLWKGGAITFGPTKDRNFAKKINKKMKRKALFMTLSDKATEKLLILVDELKLDEVKTKKLVVVMNGLFEKLEIKKLDNQEIKEDKKASAKSKTLADEKKQKTPINGKFEFKTLIVLPGSDQNLVKSSNNLSKVKAVRADSLNVKDILNYEWLVVPVESLEVIEKTYLK